MLDYSSSSTRKWAITGIVFICFSILSGIRISETYVRGTLATQFAIIRLSGTNRDPVLVFETKGGAVNCKIIRCHYPNWRNDLGAIAEIGIDEDAQVSRITIEGMTRLGSADLDGKSIKTLMVAAVLMFIGIAMCANAWRIYKKVKGK